MLTMLVCATYWLYMHLYILVYMFMHESCLLVCHPCFNTMKLWISDPNLHLSPADTTFCLLFRLFIRLLSCLVSFLVCLLVLLLVISPTTYYACHVYHAYLLYVSFICTLHLFLPLLICWFLVFSFACTHTEQGCMELEHDLLGASKRSAGTSM